MSHVTVSFVVERCGLPYRRQYRRTSAETLKKVQNGQGLDRFDAGIEALASEHVDQILAKVSEKLDKRLSVEYTVNDWNRQAMDVENLAVIFSGESHRSVFLSHSSEPFVCTTYRLAGLALETTSNDDTSSCSEAFAVTDDNTIRQAYYDLYEHFPHATSLV